ncbi:N-acetylmuramidase domain-containing protein [Aquiflexum sp.]|uniref:N-acetylmuramidase domain-containing protein n=1 Tax=Aquiflexum sp. TaxID=1872584 RepID=UPI0035938CF1
MKELNNSFYQLWIKIAATVILTIIVGFFLRHFFQEDQNVLAWTLPSIIALGLIYWVVISYFKEKDVRNSYYVNKYHDVFFKGTIIFAILLVSISITYSVLMYLEQKNIFAIVGLLMLVSWLAVFMIYFVWSVYHYNINFGITDGEWAEIAEAKRQGRNLELENPDFQIREPKYNPYRSQTFGLPPGTVRGMIAFTLLFGGISLLVASMGTEEINPEMMQLRIQQFEFFETAFLMMIAFYFGDRSLKYFRDRWRNPNQSSTNQDPSIIRTQSNTSNTDGIPPTTIGFDDSLSEDDRAFFEDDREFGLSTQKEEPTPSSFTELKNNLIKTSPEPDESVNTFGFVQIKDNVNGKILNDDQLMDSLEKLAESKDLILSLSVVKAVIEVESSGRGHLKNGDAKILFEGHLFWRLLKNKGMSEDELEKLQKPNKDILYKSWTREFYKGGIGEYERLERAKKIDPKLAVYSASWGLFQILGENLDHNIKSRIGEGEDQYKSWIEFEEKQHEHEKYHFLDFMAFIMTKKFKGTPLINFISENENSNGNYNWANFAHGYNGSGYKANKYDIRLQAAYEKHRKLLQ